MLKKIFKKYVSKKKLTNGSLKESIETVLDSQDKGTEGISKQERLMLSNIL